MVLCFFKELIFKNSRYALYLSTALGFLAGLVVNYILSIFFVFTYSRGTKMGRNVVDIIVFTLIGVIGLLISESGMFLGSEKLGINYMIVKIVVTIAVLLWNYIARKVLIFSDWKAKSLINNIKT